mgnify:CR=1 FL=1
MFLVSLFWPLILFSSEPLTVFQKATYLEGLLENMSIVQSGLPYTSQDCKGQPFSGKQLRDNL